jgi:hypothetical protein
MEKMAEIIDLVDKLRSVKNIENAYIDDGSRSKKHKNIPMLHIIWGDRAHTMVNYEDRIIDYLKKEIEKATT